MTSSPNGPKPDVPDPLRNFTAAGRLWLACCITLGVASLGAFVAEVVPGLPSGSYPWLLFVLPVAVATTGIYFAGNWLLRKGGVRLRNPDGAAPGEAGSDPTPRGHPPH